MSPSIVSQYAPSPDPQREALSCAKTGASNGTTGEEDMQDRVEQGLCAAQSRVLKLVWPRSLLPSADLPDVFPSVMRFPPHDVLHPTNDDDDEAYYALPSRKIATGMRMIPIAPHLFKPPQEETVIMNIHRHTHHHRHDAHYNHKDSEHYSHATNSEHHTHLSGSFVYCHGGDTHAMHYGDDHPHHASHSPLTCTEPEPTQRVGLGLGALEEIVLPRAQTRLRASSAKALQPSLSVITNTEHDISVVTAILRDAQLLGEPKHPTRRRAEQVAVLKVLQQRRSEKDAIQLERRRYDRQDLERRLTPDPSHPEPSTHFKDSP